MIESSRVLACITVAILCVVAGFLVSQTERNAYIAEGNTNPHASLTFAFINNASSSENTQSAQQKSPHWYTSPEWWLVIVAVPSIILIWYQARETARSAKAAEDNVKIIMSKERGRVWVELQPREFNDGIPHSNRILTCRVRYEGFTPVDILEANIGGIVTTTQELPDWPFFHRMVIPDVISSSTEQEELVSETIITGHEPNETFLREHTLYLHCAGYITYKDAFEQKWEREFRFRWRPFDDGAIGGTWEKGEVEENKETQVS